jgi:flagellin
MRINTNIASMNALESVTQTGKKMTSSLEKLSSGLRLNKASDDASGMAIADKLRTQASSLGQAIANANSANALIQMADKAMAEQSNILDMVKTRLMQASTSTTSQDGREAILNDTQALLTQFNNISTTTNYNTTTLLDGSDFEFQIGELDTDIVSVSTSYAVTTSALGGASSKLDDILGASTFTASSAKTFLTYVDTALTQLNTVRSEFGSAQNQVESALRNMMTTKTNITAAESIIRDVDYAAESANFNKQNIIAQAGTYAISQANAIQQNVLRLLQ